MEGGGVSDPKEFDRIWLQTCGDSMSEWYGEITWCQDKVHDDDVEYVSARLYAELKQQRDELLAALNAIHELRPLGIGSSEYALTVESMARAAIAKVKS